MFATTRTPCEEATPALTRRRRLLSTSPSALKVTPLLKKRQKLLQRRLTTEASSTTSSSPKRKEEEEEDASSDDDDFFTKNDALARRLPLYFGSSSLTLLLINRVFSNVAPTLNAASSQSRADVIDVVMSATLILTGLTLVSIAPRIPETVIMDGYDVNYVDSSLSERCKEELRWSGKTLREASKCASVTVVELDDVKDGEMSGGKVVFYDGTCCAKDPNALFENETRQIGSVCKEVLTSGKQNYMANANLFPGRFEFIQDDQEMISLIKSNNNTATTAKTTKNNNNKKKGFGLPQNSQAICCVAVGDARLLVLSADRQRGFTKVDQAWFELVAQKLDNAFSSDE